jgi:hypothetical protein
MQALQGHLFSGTRFVSLVGTAPSPLRRQGVLKGTGAKGDPQLSHHTSLAPRGAGARRCAGGVSVYVYSRWRAASWPSRDRLEKENFPRFLNAI